MEDKEISVVKGDRKSIGGSRLKRVNIPFTNEELIFNKGDMIYLFSDGIIDQNDDERKKFGSTRFIDLINQIGKEDIDSQYKRIEESLVSHQGLEEQRDDITVWGIKL
jgi:serine phosphatase RsbU (regulator of sigma subunit)